jgi:glycosyltransferase involved in cell wall biosynthesis
MYEELVRLGHDVHVYTPVHRIWLDMPKFDPRVHYDLGILNHSNCLEHLRKHNIDKIIYTSHGIIPQPEWPVPGADIYVSVSEEVQANVQKRWGIDSIVIRNPIDTQRFAPSKPVEDKLTNILFLSNYGWTVMESIRGAASQFEFHHLGGEERHEQVEEFINDADLVIGLGRSVYEAMACGRNVIIYDYMGADGFVTPTNIYEYRLKNCSGRTNRISYTPDMLLAEFRHYDPSLGPALRSYILEHNNVETIAQEYLSL